MTQRLTEAKGRRHEYWHDCKHAADEQGAKFGWSFVGTVAQSIHGAVQELHAYRESNIQKTTYSHTDTESGMQQT